MKVKYFIAAAAAVLAVCGAALSIHNIKNTFPGLSGEAKPEESSLPVQTEQKLFVRAERQA